MASEAVDMRAYTHMFCEEVNYAIECIIENRCIKGWPALGPRLERTLTAVNFLPHAGQYHLEGEISIFGPEDEANNFARPHVRTVRAELWIQEGDLDASTAHHPMRAVAEMLKDRAEAVLRELF